MATEGSSAVPAAGGRGVRNGGEVLLAWLGEEGGDDAVARWCCPGITASLRSLCGSPAR